MTKIAVLVSGGGTNLQRIIDAIASGELQNCELSIVIADRDCYALQRAKNHNISTALIERSPAFSVVLQNALPSDIQYIVLAGFLSILSASFCERWNDKILNIHPSLLPKYGGKGMYGDKVHAAVLQNQEVESGATVHFVTDKIDEGAIVMQKKVTVNQEDTIETLACKIHEVEHEILINALHKIINNIL